MKLNKMTRCLLVALMLAILAVTCGCGSDGGSASTETSVKSATVSIIPSGNGEYVVQGDNLDGVGGIDLTISYDSATMASPTVISGALISGALMMSNPNVPGTIKIAIISTEGFVGSGQIATISFASVTGTGNVSVSSVQLIRKNGSTVGTGTAPTAVPPDASTGTPASSTGPVPSQQGTVSGQRNSTASSL